VTRKETVLVKWGEDIDQTVNKDDRMCYCMSGAAREIPLKNSSPRVWAEQWGWTVFKMEVAGASSM
jgi:hypothetical protein